jgi:hypothetical protein
MTLEEIGEKFGLTREKVRQIGRGYSPAAPASRSKLLKIPGVIYNYCYVYKQGVACNVSAIR